MARRGAGEGALVAALLALLALAIVYPLLHVLSVAFLDGGWPTARPLLAFFARPLFREALANTLLSGLVAVVYSTIVFMTPIGVRAAFGVPLRPRLLAAAALGVTGVALLFLPELRAAGRGGSTAYGVVLVLCAAFACASGNLIAMRNHDAGIPTIPGTAWMMIYGTLFAAAVAKVSGAPWTFDARPAYVLSLAYLAVGGSVVAFVTYFALLKRVGAGPSSYVAIATPVIALLLSTFLEGYQWTPGAAAGMALAVFGNGLALRTAAAAR